MESNKKSAIQAAIRAMMDRVMDKVLFVDPFKPAEHHATRPLYAALVPDEIFKGAHFERRFVTPFGHVWERVACVAARTGRGTGEVGCDLRGTIREGRLNRIHETLARLEHAASRGGSRQQPDWNTELTYILQGRGPEIPISVVADLYVKDAASGERLAFELKAPMPNSDQTKASKEKILVLHAMEPRLVDAAYFALPYNPYGLRCDYKWPFPGRWFNMREDAVVLIGDEFWDMVGGPGTYAAFVEAVNELGPEYKLRIYREFLGIEPPPDAEFLKL